MKMLSPVFCAVFGVLFLSCLAPVQTQAMHASLELPTTFHLQTALDSLSVHAVCRTAGYLAGIGLLYNATRLWASAARYSRLWRYVGAGDYVPADNLTPDQAVTARLEEARLARQAKRYAVAGGAFLAASFLSNYGKELLHKIPTVVSYVRQLGRK